MLSILRLEGECIGLAILGQGVGLKVCFQRHGQFLGGCVFFAKLLPACRFQDFGLFPNPASMCWLLPALGILVALLFPFILPMLVCAFLMTCDNSDFSGESAWLVSQSREKSYEDQVVVGGTIF